MIDRANKNWNNEISDEEILDREFTIGYLIQSNQHLDIFKQLKELVLSNYFVVAEFRYMGFNGGSIYCNGQRLVYRTNKSKDFKLGKGVNLMNHNLSHSGGGSNNYPSIAFDGAKCTLEFTSYGLPYVDKINGWSIKIISLTPSPNP